MSHSDDLLQERIQRLLPSQKFWLLAPERERIIMAGYRAGKTRIGCTAGILLSYLVPGNFGFIGRASGKDLTTTTLKTFYEVCPEEMIVGKPKRIGQSGLLFSLHTKEPGRISEVYFDYIIDKQSGKSHLAGGDWGWFFVDQVEEIARADWAKMIGRLSRTTYDTVQKKRVPIKTHALGAGNQIGHDWIWEDFFAEEVHAGKTTPGNYVLDPKKEPNVFYKAVHRDLPRVNGKQFSRLGVVTRAEENKMSNGGFVPDDYFDGERATNTPEWVARYLDGSFDDFSGKIYSGYNLSSVHNIEPFPIPAHWPWYCSIDVGGSVPWGVGVWRVDEDGNCIMVSDAPELYQFNLNPNKAIQWIKKNVPIEKTRFIIDYQNRPVMIQLQDEGIHCEPAMKDMTAGIMQTQRDFYVNPENALPVWYERTQPPERHAQFRGKGAPKTYLFNICKNAAKELDNYIWDPNKPNQPKGGQNDHHCDETKYFHASNPQPAVGIIDDPFRAFRASDPTSAVHLDRVSRELQRHRQAEYLRDVRESDPCDGGVTPDEPQFVSNFGDYF